MNEKICQSCGMPLNNKEELGTNKDGSINDDYCKYCYKDGEKIVANKDKNHLTASILFFCAFICFFISS